MAKGRYGRSNDNSEIDKNRKVNKEGFRELMGIFRFILPHKGYFIAALIALFLGIFTTLSFPYFLGELVNIAAPGAMDGLAGSQVSAASGIKESLNQLIPKDIDSIALMLVGILCIQAVLSFSRIYFSEQVSQRTMADIRYATYEKLITFSLPFFEQRRVGELTSRLSSDVTQLQDVLSFTLFEFLRQVLILFFGLGILFTVVSAKLTLFMLSIIPLVMIGALIFGKYIRKISKQSQDQLAETNTIVDETLHAILVVKAFASEMREAIRYKSGLNKVVNIALKAAVFRGIFSAFIFAVLFGGITLIIWKGAGMIQTGEIMPGDLVKFVVYTAFIAGSVAGLGNIYGQLQKTIGASDRIREILEQEPEFDIADQRKDKFPRLEGRIQFQEVAFSYPARTDVVVLKDISFSIAAGKKIALVGQSGAGKSTIAQLILRFYSIQEGKILIDDRSILSYPIPELRNNIGIVPQEVILFGGTIRENIAYGRPDASEESLLAAAKQANAWEFIEGFPDQLDTVVGERGIKLSGGQRQRIAIARAILKDPAILILDEATSSLDAESEHLVQSALNRLMEGRTTVIIAHRLSTIREVDKIYVLDQGNIIESGTHEELAGLANGAYSSLLRLQLESS